jgi:prolyl oligopeptidase
MEASATGRLTYPAARVQEVVDDYHGTRVSDPYRWLEDESSPETRRWIEAQNALTSSQLGFGERPALRARLEKLWGAAVATTPNLRGDRYFYSRRRGLQNQPILYVSRGAMKRDEQVLLDPNTMSTDGTVAVDWQYPSPSGDLFAYGRSSSGSERSTLHLVDIQGKERPDRIPDTRSSGLAWQKDERAFYYVRYPAAGSVVAGDENYFRRVYYHRLGSDYREDPLIYGEGRPKEEWLDVYSSSDWRYVFLFRSLDWSKNDLFLRPSDGGKEFVAVAAGLDGRVQGDVTGNTLVLLTNIGAPRYRIVKAPLASPGPEHWKEIVPEGEGVIENFQLAGDRLIVQVLENAHSRIYLYDLDGKRLGEVRLPTLGTVTDLTGDPGGREAYFSFSSFAYPITVFRLDPATAQTRIVEQLDLGIDLTAYETSQVWYVSKDGTRVPMFIVSKKGLEKTGDRPAWLTGYGGFELNTAPTLVRSALPWLDAGGIYCSACLRGGGEFGREWHEAGRLGKKQNVFDDFIAAAEYLIREKYTRPSRLVLQGASNGGLLVGACLVQRPDLFQAALVQVPLLDMLRYQLFSIARLWIPEYGSADDPQQFQWLYAYSPYHHVVAGTNYPAVLLSTAESDSRVAPIHALKMAARLQAASSGDRPILLRVETKAGHGQGKPISKLIDETLDHLLFAMWQTGMIHSPGSAGPVGTVEPGAADSLRPAPMGSRNR